MPDAMKTRADLEWTILLERIARDCLSEVAVRRVLDMTPADTLDEANRLGELSREAMATMAAGHPIPAGPVVDLEEILVSLERGRVLAGPELRAAGEMAATALRISRFSRDGKDSPRLAETLVASDALAALAERITAAVDRDGEVTDAASAELRRARQKARETKNELRGLMTRLVSRYADALSDAFHTDYDGRYALPVRADAPYRVEGIVLGTSGSGATLYVEPREATDLGNRHRVALADVERETARVLAELSSRARDHAPALAEAFETCIAADVLGAIARYGTRTASVVLEVQRDASAVLRNMRHPLLVDGGEVVPNDLVVRCPGCLVISGPNAGGKTVALKCLGLAAWMARAGLPLPVDDEGSHIGWFAPVLTDIGDEQSLARSLSTFSAHTARLAEYVNNAGPATLVLLDEVAGGTDPDEGAALAVAILEALVERGAAVAVTTHYDRLKHLAADDDRFENASVGFDVTNMRPTFRLTLGRPGASSALAVAERFGMPPSVVERARGLLPETWETREGLIARLETATAAAERARDEAEQDRATQTALRRELEEERKRVREKERARLARETEAVLVDVREARADLMRAKKQLGRGSDVGAAEKTINEAAAHVALGSPVHQLLRDEPVATPDTGAVARGAVVRVRPLGVTGTVESAPDDRGRVTLRSGTMKLTAKAADLVVLTAAPTSAVPRKTSRKRAAAAPRDESGPELRTTDNTCDLRGFRVEDVEAELGTFVDRLIARGESVGFVLHGHGTGALKSAVRERLPSVPFVRHVRPATREEGGDAFTVVTISD